jgi:hypothetical protein
MNIAPKTNQPRRSRRLIVRLTDEDDARIRENAKKAGLRLSEYIRTVALEGQIVVVQQSGFGLELARQLRAVGNNLNQLTRDYNTDGEYPPELGGVCVKLEAIFDRIIRTSERL